MRVINLRTRMLVRAVPYYTRPDVLRVAARSGAVVLVFIGCDREGAGQTSSRCHPSTIYAADGSAFDPRTSPYESDFPSEEPHRIAAGFDLDVTSCGSPDGPSRDLTAASAARTYCPRPATRAKPAARAPTEPWCGVPSYSSPPRRRATSPAATPTAGATSSAGKGPTAASGILWWSQGRWWRRRSQALHLAPNESASGPFGVVACCAKWTPESTPRSALQPERAGWP